MAWRSTPAERAEVIDSFLMFDRSNTGVITHDDLVNILTRFDVPADECLTIFNALESNTRGHIDFSRFLAATLQPNDQLVKRTSSCIDEEANAHGTSALEQMLSP